MSRKGSFSRWETKLERFSVPHLMTVIVGMMAVIYFLDSVFIARLGFSLSEHLTFDRTAVLNGQIWRIITFVFLPVDSNILFLLLSLYFYYLIGNALEREWGAFRFNLFYLCGILGALIGGFISGYASNTYLNLSLFLAFAILYPDFEVLLFFILPVKIKYIAFADLVLLLLMLITGSWSVRAMILFAFINLALFFWRDLKGLIDRLLWKYRLNKRFRR